MASESNHSPMIRRFAFALLWLATSAFAQDTLEVISLRHRTADQVIPLLRPLLDPGGALTGQHSQLIVRTSPSNLAQLRAALEAIDRPARRLMISVRFDGAQESARGGVQGTARATSGASGATVAIGESRSAGSERVDQRMQVLEGGRAVISTGEARPLRQRQVIQTPSGPVVRETTELVDAASGFEVVPRVAGDTVTLDIAPQREQFVPGVPGTVRYERTASSVSGRLGEWIELAGVDSSSAGAERGMRGAAGNIPDTSARGAFSSRDSSASAQRRVWVKVEEIR
jgi:type II secretory pathway component GspD/PulD (secretin)